MKTEDMIHVNRLLRQREEIYTEILDCEEKIYIALGQRYQLSNPPELPSIFRAPKKITKRRKQTRPVRKLNTTNENGYRITFISNDEIKTDLIRDVRLIRRLITFEIPFFRLVKVETVMISGHNKVESVELLHYDRKLLETNV